MVSLFQASHMAKSRINVDKNMMQLKQPQPLLIPLFLLSPTRMTLYIGKDEAGFYVSKALVHTGVTLVVRRGF